MPEIEQTPFGQYQLIEKIAQGGMAEIFRGKALDAQGIERPVVIKRILPHIAASPEFVEMLIDEAKIAVQLSHGNIAQIFDLGKVADDYFIVMEYVEGKTLSQIMKRLRNQGKMMPIAFAAYLCAEVANGLDYMHRKTDERGTPLHIIHRDISPQNIILSTAGTVKIIDFGIAKAKTKVSTTDSGVLKGKFAYMSPEHAEGEKLDHRSDIFSLGVILYELLTNERLLKGKNNAETIRKVKKAKIPVPSKIRSTIPRILDQIVLKSLQKDRDRRYQSAHDLTQDLTRFWVSHQTAFSPRDLIGYLHELFPELIPQERISEEEATPLKPLEIRRDDSRALMETHEDTVAADSEVIRTKLKETEVFDVPAAEHHKDDENPALPKAPTTEEDEQTSRFQTKRITVRILIAAAALALMAGGIYLARSHFKGKAIKGSFENELEAIRKQWIRKEPPTPEEEPQPLLPPEPPAPIAHPEPKPLPLPATVPPVLSGSLLVDSTPRGARIFLNDADTNRLTPATFERLPAGSTQKVGLHLDRHQFWQGEIQVQQGKGSRIVAALEINFGDLEINSLPEGASVVLNGQPAGKTPFRLTRLAPETLFDVRLTLPGYQSWSEQVKIFGGKTEVINASLKRLPRDEPLP